MYYVIYAEDSEDSLEKRRAVRASHLMRLKELEKHGRLLLAGPLLKDDQGNPLAKGFKGSLIIAEFDSWDDAKAWAAADPYVTAKVYSRVTVMPFNKIMP